MPFGPDVSWPTGYSDMEYRDGDYRYPARQAAQLPAAQGEHPYAAFSAAGYGDDGYSNPGYDGPMSQDAGIAGTRTVRGFVEPGQADPGYGQPGGYGRPGYAPGGHPGNGYGQAGHPAPGYRAPEPHQPADSYRQPWDYGLPLRYEGEEPPYPAQDRYGQPDGYGQQGNYRNPDGYGSGAYHAAPAYDPADYNGSAYSRPGIDGPGYDLSGIIGTGDFEALSAGYDEPSYDRLSYDDPRYDEPRYDDPRYEPRYDEPRYDEPAGGPRFDETRLDLAGFGGTRSDGPRFDGPRFDETRLDSLWLSDEDTRHDAATGYENDGFGGDGPVRSGYPSNSARFDETRLDLSTADLRMDHTRFDVPAFDETRIDNMRALGPAADLRPAATGLLAPPEDRPMSWAEESSFDEFGDLDLDPAQAPAAFVRTAERYDDTATRRAAGRRRGRSGDRRQWMALGAIAVVAAGAIGGVLMKYVFSGPSGPAHAVAAPSQLDGFTRQPNLEKQFKVDALRETVMKASSGQASNLVSAVYQQGNAVSGGNEQVFMFVGGNLSSAAPATSIANFTQSYPGAKVVPAGSLGGEAACAEAQMNGEGVAMCVWFDNDSFGALVSPTMTTAKLATTLDQVRPNLETYSAK